MTKKIKDDDLNKISGGVDAIDLELNPGGGRGEDSVTGPGTRVTPPGPPNPSEGSDDPTRDNPVRGIAPDLT